MKRIITLAFLGALSNCYGSTEQVNKKAYGLRSKQIQDCDDDVHGNGHAYGRADRADREGREFGLEQGNGHAYAYGRREEGAERKVREIQDGKGHAYGRADRAHREGQEFGLEQGNGHAYAYGHIRR